MSISGLYVGKVKELPILFNELKNLGYKVIGYKAIDNVLRLDSINSFEELAFNVKDVQSPGRYLLSQGGFPRHGPDSPKKFLYPSKLVLFKIMPDWNIVASPSPDSRIALFGIKPCDLSAIKVLDKVLLNVDEYYTALRRNLVVVVENCIEPGGTCFCTTMGTGPRARDSFDIAYTRLGDKLAIEAGSSFGLKLLNLLEVEPIDDATYREFETTINRSAEKARALFTVDNIPETLELNIESQIYKEIAEKCLGCANCNMVCPTCFCFDVTDVPKIDGSAERVRVWDGCLSYTYAQVAGGHFRKDLWTRYRHFVLHKFAYWIKQFGTYGCVGCGRCITWCPTGIDLRESIEKIIRGGKN
jgi:ferredoxin